MKYMSLFELRELCKPVFEQEEVQRKRRIANFLKALSPKGYNKTAQQ